MYYIKQLESLIRCTYPTKVSPRTQKRRLDNINAVQKLVGEAVEENNLSHVNREERLHIFTTQRGEKIFIQYPGKESTLSGEKYRKCDFRPRIMTSTGEMLRDLVFADMWGLIEDLNTQQHRLLKIMAAIFFRLGRMTLHREVDKDYTCETLDSDENVIASSVRHLHWYEFHVDDEIMESLNFHAENLIVDGKEISLEAFLCFFELILQNEDSKYYDKKGNLSSGRIPTSDSMLLLSSALFGRIKLSVLLQRFVSGFGVAHCGIDEVESATDGLIKIVDRKQELKSYLESRHITVRENSIITVRGKGYSVLLKTTTPRIAILSNATDDARNDLVSAGWTVYDVDELTDIDAYNAVIGRYNETP